jgi:hypothetical protein
MPGRARTLKNPTADSLVRKIRVADMVKSRVGQGCENFSIIRAYSEPLASF